MAFAGNFAGTFGVGSEGKVPSEPTVEDLKKKEDPLPPTSDAPFAEKMIHRVATNAGRARYKLRQQTIEPIFGIIKETMDFRRFLMRGLSKVSLEWTLVTLDYNLKRLFTMGAPSEDRLKNLQTTSQSNCKTRLRGWQ